MKLLFEEIYESSENNLELYLAEYTSMIQRAIINQGKEDIVKELDNVRKAMHKRILQDSTMNPAEEMDILNIINAEHETLTAMFKRLKQD